ncbi:MAG TPA: hypothetical protein VM581_02950 [Magnetospirillaceae bacterium]|nr:hypothetical protein [Magnetospirillaceae bacterium]
MSRSKVRVLLLGMMVVLTAVVALVAASRMSQDPGTSRLALWLITGVGTGFGTLMSWMIIMLTRREPYPEKVPWTLRRLPRQYIRLAEVMSFQRLTSEDLSQKVDEWSREFPADCTASQN